MNGTPHFKYRGDGQKPEKRHPDSPQQPEPYLPSPELVKAVNLAIFVGRPLLLEGEAGSGKSRLAYSVAYELGLPLYVWSVRSTSKAEEGLYTYDALLRLYDVQTAKDLPGKTLERDPNDPKQYRYFGELGKAFILEDCPAVVLIDEIDKADIDFPNDLLNVLDEPRSFRIPETGETITAKHNPIVIITSNKEKGNLPAPFLRRCVYFYLAFPDKIEELKKIIDIHFKIEDELLNSASSRFLQIRATKLHKKPGTSEFIDWIKALNEFDSTAYPAKKLEDPNLEVPYQELLFKLRADLPQKSQDLG